MVLIHFPIAIPPPGSTKRMFDPPGRYPIRMSFSSPLKRHRRHRQVPEGKTVAFVEYEEKRDANDAILEMTLGRRRAAVFHLGRRWVFWAVLKGEVKGKEEDKIMEEEVTHELPEFRVELWNRAESLIWVELIDEPVLQKGRSKWGRLPMLTSTLCEG